MKPRITKQRRKVLDKIEKVPLAWGYTEHGAKEFFFTDGSGVSAGLVKRMLECGLLKTTETVLGIGQEITR